MRITLIIFSLFAFSVKLQAQKFYLGEKIQINASQFKLLSISSETKVASYKYIGVITDKYFFGRRIGDIIVGVKNNVVVTTVYSLIPDLTDVGVPTDIIDLIESNLPYPFTYQNGIYGLRVDGMNITLSRTNNALTFHKDRIMYFTSFDNNLLRK